MAVLTFKTKKGDTGRPFRVLLYSGAVALEGNWTAKLTVWKDGSNANKINNQPMTLLDQSIKANWGWFEYYPTEDEINEAGEFLAEVDVFRPDNLKFQLPDDADAITQPYFKFIVQESRA